MKLVKVDEKVLDHLCCSIVQAIKEVFQNELICLLLHGSTIKGGFIEGFSDIDLQLFLTETAFDEFGLKLSKATALQKLIGTIDLNPIKAAYLQLIYLRPQRIPQWYTPPFQGSLRVLCGELPKVFEYDPLRFKEKIIRSLKEVKNHLNNMIVNFSDSNNQNLFRRVRYAVTKIFPVMYGLCSYELNDPKVIWTKAKDEVLTLFCEKYTGKVIEDHLRNVFQQIVLLGKNPNDYPLAREAFTNSINFLKEAAKIADAL